MGSELYVNQSILNSQASFYVLKKKIIHLVIKLI